MLIAEAISIGHEKLEEFQRALYCEECDHGVEHKECSVEDTNEIFHVKGVLEVLFELRDLGVEEVPYDIADNPFELKRMQVAALNGWLDEYISERE